MPEPRQRESDLIWMRPRRGASSPRVTISRDQITAAAITIADSQGIGAVSMRQVATALGCGTMSLYRHVRTKDELYELMIDSVVGEELARMPERSGRWRADLRAYARERRASVLRHPWLPRVQAGRPCLGPNVVAATEYALSVVIDLSPSMDEMIRVIRTVDAFVQGFVQLELAERGWRTQPGEVADEAPKWFADTVDYLRKLSETGDYPLFTRMVEEAKSELDPDGDFEWQLARVLDGFASVTARQSDSEPSGLSI